jgi:uncharacterized protein (DUF169 family)
MTHKKRTYAKRAWRAAEGACGEHGSEPEAINSARTAGSFGCVGNRVYTRPADDDAYLAIPGAHLQAVEEKLAVIVRANEELEKFHRARAASCVRPLNVLRSLTAICSSPR